MQPLHTAPYTNEEELNRKAVFDFTLILYLNLCHKSKFKSMVVASSGLSDKFPVSLDESSTVDAVSSHDVVSEVVAAANHLQGIRSWTEGLGS